MASAQFTDNGTFTVPMAALGQGAVFNGRDYIITWAGAAAGGTLRVYSSISGLLTPIPNAAVAIGELDGDGNARQQMRFWTKGELAVQLGGASGGINLDVRVL